MEAPVAEWLSSDKEDLNAQVQYLEKAVCISHSTNTLGKGMNTTILLPAIGKW